MIGAAARVMAERPSSAGLADLVALVLVAGLAPRWLEAQARRVWAARHRRHEVRARIPHLSADDLTAAFPVDDEEAA